MVRPLKHGGFGGEAAKRSGPVAATSAEHQGASRDGRGSAAQHHCPKQSPRGPFSTLLTRRVVIPLAIAQAVKQAGGSRRREVGSPATAGAGWPKTFGTVGSTKGDPQVIKPRPPLSTLRFPPDLSSLSYETSSTGGCFCRVFRALMAFLGPFPVWQCPSEESPRCHQAKERHLPHPTRVPLLPPGIAAAQNPKSARPHLNLPLL